MFDFTLNPAKPVSYSETAIKKALDAQGSLTAEVKYDSVRCLLVIKKGEDLCGQPTARCYALSRTDKLIPALREMFISDADRIALGQFLEESLYPEGIVLDGEMMVKGTSFQEGAGMLRRKAAISVDRLSYVIYGVLPLAHFMGADKNTPFDTKTCVMQCQLDVLIHQVKELLPQLDWRLAERYEVFTMEELKELYDVVRSAGHEGLVVKAPFAVWHRGKKVGWWKMKPEDTVDGQVIGFVWGTEGKGNEGKVIGFEVMLESGQVVNACGLTQAMMAEVTAKVNTAAALVEDMPYHGWYAQVKFMEYTDDGSLRHPSFDCWRGLEDSPEVKS